MFFAIPIFNSFLLLPNKACTANLPSPDLQRFVPALGAFIAREIMIEHL
ncbi:hypothetical protein OMCYN_01715 [cyanobiont of Ornithocercus magnificus]|nr:hypothetical protein OMCYN_01715 [cyanobiont of Ornithocercus magnificus]